MSTRVRTTAVIIADDQLFFRCSTLVVEGIDQGGVEQEVDNAGDDDVAHVGAKVGAEKASPYLQKDICRWETGNCCWRLQQIQLGWRYWGSFC